METWPSLSKRVSCPFYFLTRLLLRASSASSPEVPIAPAPAPPFRFTDCCNCFTVSALKPDPARYVWCMARGWSGCLTKARSFASRAFASAGAGTLSFSTRTLPFLDVRDCSSSSSASSSMPSSSACFSSQLRFALVYRKEKFVEVRQQRQEGHMLWLLRPT